MKDRTLLCLSLLLSAVALGYAAWVQCRADQLAVAAIAKREREIVSHLAPRLRGFYQGLSEKPGGFPSDPKTFEELLDPIVTTLDQLGSSDATTNKVTK